MLINFCDPILKPIISSSGTSHEGYNVQNLISNDKRERQRGFLGYGSPPTTITIEFLSYVNIKHIVVGPQVRSKKSLGFEVSAKCCSKFNTTVEGPGVTPTRPTESNFERIGSVLLADKDRGVIFYKNNYKPKINIEPAFLYVSLFRHYAVGNTNCIKIKIFKAVSAVPAIGRIEVWGEPGRSCSRSFKNHIYKLWHQNKSYPSYGSNFAFEMPWTRPTHNQSVEMKVLQTTPAITQYDSCKQFNHLELPDEFLDSITCNLMTLPFILPSGKVVDVQTLEKHKDYEAMYGRPPSDPFTGIRFTLNSLPIPDHDLKRRIDRFIVENSHRTEFQNIPRTTGTMRRHFSTDSKKILHTNSKTLEHQTEDMTLCNYSTNHKVVKDTYVPQKVIGKLGDREMSKSLIPNTVEQPVLNRLKSVLNLQSKRKAGDTESGLDPTHKRSRGLTVPTAISKFSSPASQQARVDKTHEQLLNDSLDLALKSALAGLPSFTKSDFDDGRLGKNEQAKQPCCHCCQALELLFIFPCKTLVCRNCLPVVLGVKCSGNCDSTHQSNDVVRYHYH